MELSKGKGREEGRGGERVKKKMRRDEDGLSNSE